MALGGVIAMSAAAPTTAQAQGYNGQPYIEGNHQVRAGFFLQGSGTNFNVNDGTVSDRGRASGFGLGASGGLEWIRAGRYTWGIEMDLATGSGSTNLFGLTAPAKGSVDYTANLRGRLGFYATPEVVLYGTAGIGAVGTEISNFSAKGSATNLGFVYGLGAEYHRAGTIFFAEYLRGDYGSRTVTANTVSSAGIVTSSSTYNYDVRSDMVRVGVKFKLGHDWHDDYRHKDDQRPMK